MTRHRMNQRGSVVTELVFILPLFAIALMAVGAMGKAWLRRARAVDVARFGADLRTCGFVPEDVAQREVSAYADLQLGRSAAATVRRTIDLPSAKFYRLYEARVSGPALPHVLEGPAVAFDESVVIQEASIP